MLPRRRLEGAGGISNIDCVDDSSALTALGKEGAGVSGATRFNFSPKDPGLARTRSMLQRPVVAGGAGGSVAHFLP